MLVNASHIILTFCAQSWWVTTGCGRRCRWPHLVCCLWPGTWSCPWFPERSPDAARSGSDPGWYQLERNKVRWIMIKHWIPLFHWFSYCFFSSFTGLGVYHTSHIAWKYMETRVVGHQFTTECEKIYFWYQNNALNMPKNRRLQQVVSKENQI